MIDIYVLLVHIACMWYACIKQATGQLEALRRKLTADRRKDGQHSLPEEKKEKDRREQQKKKKEKKLSAFVVGLFSFILEEDIGQFEKQFNSCIVRSIHLHINAGADRGRRDKQHP